MPNTTTNTRDDTPPSSSKLAKTPKKIAPPSDFKTEQEFISYARKLFSDDMDYDRLNRDAGLEDALFVVGEQWDKETKTRRERRRRPTLTINRLPAFVAQIVGSRRMNETVIKVLPEAAANKLAADIRQGLIRNIEKVSRADRAYDKALENCVICGIGNFGVNVVDNEDDVFVRDITVISRPNPYSVVWDRTTTDPTGRDAGHVFVIDVMAKSVFENAYPGKMSSDLMFEQDATDARSGGWFQGDDVRVANFWRMRTRKRVFALFDDGKTVDITGREDEPGVIERIAIDPTTGEPHIRELERPYAEMYVISGTAILAGPYELPIRRVPEFRVPAWEINVGNIRQRFGLIRFMKDPQRLHNYWRSTVAEKLMMAPRARWVATKEAVAGREDQWRNAHLSDDPLLTWNGESGAPPQYTPPAQLEAALIQEANMTVQDLRDVSNLHEASLGQKSNEVSGKAILARQRVGEVGTIIYTDNLQMAQEEAGQVINDLIPVVYDTARTVKIIKPSDEATFVRINDEMDPNAIDITDGRYNTVVSTGPGYATRRVEAQESMLALFNANPQLFGVAADILVEEMDWPGAQRVSERIQKTLPPGLLDPESVPDEQREAQAQQAQQQAQIQQLQLEMEMAAAQADLQLKQAQASKAQADAQNSQANALLTNAQVEKTQADTLKVIEEIKALAPASNVELLLAQMEADELLEAEAAEAAQVQQTQEIST